MFSDDQRSPVGNAAADAPPDASCELVARLHGKRPVAVVTGATSGIGRHVALSMAGAQHALVLPARNAARANATCHALRRDTSNADIYWVACDYANLGSVRVAAERMRAHLPRLDVLVNNAGHFGGGYAETEDGFETHLQVNYLAPFLLTHLLVDLMRRAQTRRVVNVAGETARLACIRLADLNRRRGFRVLGAYGQSKLALISFSRLAARRLASDGFTINSMQPGMAATGHLAAGPAWLDRLWRAMAPGPERAARAVTRLALSSADGRSNGHYYIGRWRAPAPFAAYRKHLAERLYEQSAELVGLATAERLDAPAVRAIARS